MTTALGLTGLGLIPIGLALIWPPLGVLGLGAVLVAASWLLEDPEK